MRLILIILGGLMAVVGAAWTLQGLGILPGSFMSGNILWTVVGLPLLLIGIALCFVGVRRGAGRL